MSTIEQLLLQQLAETKKEMKRLAAERSKIKAALAAVKDVSVSGTLKQAPDELTFKQKIKIALAENFPNGAPAADILAWCNQRWPEKQIMRSSLSPQLSRLREEGEIELQGKAWILSKTKNKGSVATATEPSVNLHGDDDDGNV